MKILYKLLLNFKGEKDNIFFGIPDTQREMENMFLLRENVYKKNNYINLDSDKDEYDENNKSIYFIAQIKNEIIGTVRLIIDNPLPTIKDCFDFIEPIEIKEIPFNSRGELGRLISVPYKENIYLPRHIVLLFLLNCVCNYSRENNILGGYSFITTKLYNKIKRINIPFRAIKKFKQKYPINGLMSPYFNKKGNPILPIYFKLEEVEKYLAKFFQNKMMFKKISFYEFELIDSVYSKFLRLLKII